MAKSDKNPSLGQVDLLKELSPESLEKVEANCVWRSYKPGESIFEYLEESDDVFFVCSGDVRVIIYSASGKPVSFTDAGPGHMFGEYPAIDGLSRSATVEARTDCVIASMPAATFRELLRNEATAADVMLERLVSTIRRLSMRVYEFSAAVSAITGRRIYSEVQGIRAKDTYPDEEVKAELVEKTFPKSAEDMTLKLSNVSAAFYGLLLEDVGQRFGWSEVDTFSKSVFTKLGRLKTAEALELGIDVPKDSRALVLVFITAVHSASPEYNFEVIEYLPEETVVRVFGISRYDRIAKEMGIECKIEGDLKELGEGGRYECVFRFTM
jgi:CRP-like cAMP-binding protein